MLNIKSISIRNFLSIGNVSQGVNFDSDDLVLVLGENLDLGGNDHRNGVGKSAILNALSYALYGSSLTKIKQDNLINKTNGKGMLVSLDFEIDGIDYRIVRGRSPKKFQFLMNGKDQDVDTDEAQGDSRVSQADIERILGLSHNMFKNIVGLNTYSLPFLSMRASEQREIIEQLLGITKLSEKADLLRDQLRGTKDEMKEEEFRIKAIQEANRSTEENVKTTRVKATAWVKKHERQLRETQDALDALNQVDIEQEISSHKEIDDISASEAVVKTYSREKAVYTKDLARYKREYDKGIKDQASLKENKCPACDQGIDTHLHTEMKDSIDERVAELEGLIEDKKSGIAQLEKQISEIEIPEKPHIFYSSIDEAYNHKASLESVTQALVTERNAENPFSGQVEMLESSLQEVSYDHLNDLGDKRDHQDFLFKLLTSKDSFIRKRIIDQNLSYLNNRLAHYTDIIGLPHIVKFLSNLEVEITEHGRELDFDNLSRGERTRLILSLSWAFRDVYESLNDKINLLFIDELLDVGLDPVGIESCLKALKQMNRDSKRNIFLVSHRDELLGRVDSILKVVKEGGFTNIESVVES